MIKDSPTSEKTKQMFAETLKALLREKDFSKITITDITGRAKVNRKTFYYHFRTTDDLLAWMFEKEAVEAVSGYSKTSDFSAAIDFILDYIEKNHKMLHSLNGAIGRGAVHKFLFKEIHPLVISMIDNINPEKLPDQKLQDPDYRDFVAEFYTEAIAGMLQNWLEKDIPRNRNVVAEYTLRLLGFIEKS